MNSGANGIARRDFLAGMAALGTGALISRHEAEAQMATAQPHRIDVHHHPTPPPYVAPHTSPPEAEPHMATAQPHRIDVHHHHTPPPYVAAITAKNVPGPGRDWT